MTTLAALRPPELASSRHQAQAMLNALPTDLTGHTVVIKCDALLSSAPSFIDELVKICLVQLGADRLILHEAPPRTKHFAERSATNRGVADRLLVHDRPM